MLLATLFASVACWLFRMANADVVRYANGWIDFTNVNFWFGLEQGIAVGVVGIPDITHAVKYAHAKGVYGGGNTSSGRIKAKRRAVEKVRLCCDSFINRESPEMLKSKCDIPNDVTRHHPHFDSQDFCKNDSRIKQKALELKQLGLGTIHVTMQYQIHGDATGTECDAIYPYPPSLGGRHAVGCTF